MKEVIGVSPLLLHFFHLSAITKTGTLGAAIERSIVNMNYTTGFNEVDQKLT